MIQLLTAVKIADNTGGVVGKCIRILGGSKRRVGSVGDVIVIAVKKSNPGGKVKKGDVVKAVIVRVKKKIGRSNGSYINTGDNAVVIVNTDNSTPKGSRIFGPVAEELKKKNYTKLLALAPSII